MCKPDPCCSNCDGKVEKKNIDKSLVLFCDVKKKPVKKDGLCQWHDYDENKSQSQDWLYFVCLWRNRGEFSIF